MKAKNISKIIFICCLLWQTSSLIAQQPGDSIRKKFEHYRDRNLQEKIFAHLDQNFFLVGETVWFKLYCVDGSFHKPLNLSKVAYVEVLDKANKPVIQSKVELKNGHGNGSFFLPATLESGSYVFRCYTNWMKNFSSGFFFHQEITIVNPFVKPDIQKNTEANSLHVEFFPEGGHLVRGLQSRLGFKITDNNGVSSQSKVYVINEANDTIAAALPLKFGMGNLTFTPSSQTKYRGMIKDEKGKITYYPLPEIHDTGYVMQLSDNGAQLRITVNGNFPEGEGTSLLYMFVHSRNIIVKAESKSFSQHKAEFVVDKNVLAGGISHITIFDENTNPLCERLYFKTPDKKLTIAASNDNAEFPVRRKVNFSVKVGAPANSTPAKSRLSVSIIRQDSLSTTGHQDILSYLSLTSDIKGTIESPEFYFSSTDETVLQAADNLMLTQGWRRFSWSEISDSKKTFEHVAEYRGQIIKGKVTGKNDSLAQGVLTFLSIPGRIINLYSSRSDVNGVVQFEPPDFLGQHKLILQAEPDRAGDVNLEILTPFSNTFRTKPLPRFVLPSGIEKKFIDRTIAMQVQDVYYDESAQLITPAVDSTGFYGLADETYYLDNYTRFPVMEEVMREYVPGVFVRKRKDGFHFIVLDIVNGGVLNGEPMILLDGVPLFNADRIMSVDPRIIRKLEVVKRKYFLGPLTMNGIVSYTSYQGDVTGLEMNPGSISLNYEGLQLQREFYSPRYDTQKQLDSRLPDKRYLLYWNPSLTPKDDGTCEIEFYTSGVRGTFEINIQGLDYKGNAGYTSKTFVVK